MPQQTIFFKSFLCFYFSHAFFSRGKYVFLKYCRDGETKRKIKKVCASPRHVVCTHNAINIIIFHPFVVRFITFVSSFLFYFFFFLRRNDVYTIKSIHVIHCYISLTRNVRLILACIAPRPVCLRRETVALRIVNLRKKHVSGRLALSEDSRNHDHAVCYGFWHGRIVENDKNSITIGPVFARCHVVRYTTGARC